MAQLSTNSDSSIPDRHSGKSLMTTRNSSGWSGLPWGESVESVAAGRCSADLDLFGPFRQEIVDPALHISGDAHCSEFDEQSIFPQHVERPLEVDEDS